MLRYVTAGESHGQALVTIIEGMPAGLPITAEEVNLQLQRRQKGHGRGGRMAIETDAAEILSGIRNGLTTGGPISFMIKNRDWSNWQDIMAVEESRGARERSVHRPRPGHADLGGAMKYDHRDMRDVLERASARETASRVAAGAIFRKLLERFEMEIYSQVVSIGAVSAVPQSVDRVSLQDFRRRVESSPVRCPDESMSGQMVQAIDDARQAGESLGGCFETGILGVPPGIGTFTSWEGRLEAQLSALIMSIPAIKAVEVGAGVSNATRPGSKVHDEIFFDAGRGIHRSTNRAGGIEGGMSNGEPIWVRAHMKPIPTLYKPLFSVNTAVWAEEKADIERSDICAVPAASIVGEAMVAYGLARAFLAKVGGDFIGQIESNYATYREYLWKEWKWQRT